MSSSIIPGGAFLVARKILDSEIWELKPAWWLKVWIYIIGKANYKDHNSKLKRGDFLTSYTKIHIDCKLASEGIEEKTIENVIKWLKIAKQITTRKTTRGFIITVLNYEKFQDISCFKNYTGNSTGKYLSTTQTLHDKEIKGNKEIIRNTTLVNNPKSNETENYTSLEKNKIFDFLSKASVDERSQRGI